MTAPWGLSRVLSWTQSGGDPTSVLCLPLSSPLLQAPAPRARRSAGRPAWPWAAQGRRAGRVDCAGGVSPELFVPSELSLPRGPGPSHLPDKLEESTERLEVHPRDGSAGRADGGGQHSRGLGLAHWQTRASLQGSRRSPARGGAQAEPGATWSCPPKSLDPHLSPDSGAVGSRPFSHSQARIPIRGTRVPSGPLDMSPGPAAKAPGRGRCAPRTFTWLCAQPSLPPCPFPENGTVPSSQERTTCSVALMTRDSQNQLQTWLTSPLVSVPLLLNHVLHQ